MRLFKPLKKLDIIVSELLGSFGDNELSPECLYNVQSFLNENGIMIPHSYMSYIRPVTCPVIWANVFILIN
jgi:protein arginine N-methyltransferase 5